MLVRPLGTNADFRPVVHVFVGDNEQRRAGPHGIDRGQGKDSPAKAGKSKEGAFSLRLDALYSAEVMTVGTHYREALTATEPVLAYSATATKTEAGINFRP
jgi:hypothetical protein